MGQEFCNECHDCTNLEYLESDLAQIKYLNNPLYEKGTLNNSFFNIKTDFQNDTSFLSNNNTSRNETPRESFYNKKIFENYYIKIFKPKIKEEKNDFINFLLSNNDFPYNEPINKNYLNSLIFPEEIYLGKKEENSKDYITRFNLLFPDKINKVENDIEIQNKNAIKIQRYFRQKNKKKIYFEFIEPDYLVTIYENEYDIYPIIKSIEIIIYSKLFQQNKTIYKTIEELFGIKNINREQIKERIEDIIRKVLGIKNKRNEDEDYYNKKKAELSSSDFNDFEND